MASRTTKSFTHPEVDNDDQESFSIELCICHPRKRVCECVNWTMNPRRRYVGCQAFRDVPGSGCGYYMWIDDPLPPHVENIISGLLHKKIVAEQAVQRWESKVQELRATERKLNEELESQIEEKNAQLEEYMTVIAEMKSFVGMNKALMAENKLLRSKFACLGVTLIFVIGVFIMMTLMYV